MHSESNLYFNVFKILILLTKYNENTQSIYTVHHNKIKNTQIALKMIKYVLRKEYHKK